MGHELPDARPPRRRRLPLRLESDGCATTRTASPTTAAPGAPALVELPVHWSLDDWNRYNYVPGLTGTGVIGRPSAVVDAWTEELEAIVEVGGLFTPDDAPVRVRVGPRAPPPSNA